jgi:hypothetical protein
VTLVTLGDLDHIGQETATEAGCRIMGYYIPGLTNHLSCPKANGVPMILRQSALLILLAALVGCAGGTRIRVAEGDDTTSNEPVSLAPQPEPVEPEVAAAPQPAAPDTTMQDTANAPAQGYAPSQGYAPYGNARTLEIRRIGQWTRTGIGEARRLVIKDANTWAQFWSELGVGDRPTVDFTRDVAVVAAAGQRQTGGHEIAIDRVTQTDGELTVEVVERTPGPNCMTTASLTQPVDVVIVPAADARSWSFVQRKEIRGCH